MQNLKFSLGIKRNILMLKTLHSSVNNSIFLCLFLPRGRLKISLTWREGWLDCSLRSLSHSLPSFESTLVVSSSMTQCQCLPSCGDTEDRCLSTLNAALQFFPVTWQVNHIAKWTVSSTCSEVPTLLSTLAENKAHLLAQQGERERERRDQRNG